MRSPRSSVRLVVLIVFGALAVAACGALSADRPVSPDAILVNGAGATFPFPLYSRWFWEYAHANTTTRFNYQSIGSGGGIRQIKEQTVDFAGSDAILTDQDRKDVAPAVLQMLPTVAGAVVPVYNLKELQGQAALVLDAAVLSDIFLGKINKWNDPAVAALNPQVKNLPAKDIIVVHRSDGSGTTAIFTSFLSSVSFEWKERVGHGTSVRWPKGLGGKGNEGIAGLVMFNEGTIGYVEYAFAKQNSLQLVSLKNAAGAVVTPSTESTQNAMADFGDAMPDTLVLSIVNAPGSNSWPIAGYTYLIIYMDQHDCTKGKAMVDFMRWALSDRAAAYAIELQYVPLPERIRTLVRAKLDQVTCQGLPIR